MTQEPEVQPVLVCGFGRCGSSLTMKMLQAGGFPVIGSSPDFEVDQAAHVPLSLAWLQSIGGSAAKVLDPHRGRLSPLLPYKIVWLDRDHAEQGKSQAKFMRLMLGFPAGRREARLFAKSYARDRTKCFAMFSQIGADVLVMAFEDILASPQASAERLATFIGIEDRNVAAMAAVVIPRAASCAPSLEIEIAS